MGDRGLLAFGVFCFEAAALLSSLKNRGLFFSPFFVLDRFLAAICRQQHQLLRMNGVLETELKSADLIELASKGDFGAIEEILNQHQGMVYGTCLRILGNVADAEDAAQATFLLFLKKCRKLKKETVLSGWLYRAAALVSREHLRASVRRRRREEKSEFVEKEDHPDSVWTELEPELDGALKVLSRKYREVVVLRYLEGRSTDEAAEVLGVTPSTVSTRLGRANKDPRRKQRGI